ncbi:RND family transporter [Halorhabdus sp. CBA1104]|uniref:MMPL family transporter n=1 Tax=unclassified Halorhabdus TaxID=2621901 RepID=UPI0012B1DCB8|nr:MULTISPECIES: MMPL family transporter [unclassified Halorhabdus]QGN06425.1 RND family transporter [Halorhabdus sp. CBA1104]
MGLSDRLFEQVIEHSKVAIVVLLVLTVAVGAGATQVSQSSSLDQFQGQTTESAKLDYIETNFSAGESNTTSVQAIIRDENVLDKDSLTEMLAMQAELRENETVNGTLAEQNAIVGIPNIVATAGIRAEIGQQLRTTAAEFERLNRTVTRERTAIAKRATQLEQRAVRLNETAKRLQRALQTIQRRPAADARTLFEQVDANSTVTLDEEHFSTFNRSVQQLRAATNESQRKAAYTLGTQGVLRSEYQQLQRNRTALTDRTDDLESKAQRLKSVGAELQTRQSQLENASAASLSAQREQLASMNESEIDAVLGQILSQNGGSGQAFAFMPTGYEPGSPNANATMWLITQTSGGERSAGAVSDRLMDSQLAMETVLSEAATENDDAIVFGTGKISDEINRSMTDSLAIVGPLALLFVVLALIVAYRDVLDILLGVVGIGAVLIMTFGFMGWADIPFNQMFIAVPVLLIGLSIDYAIHTFMRHREERHNDHTASSVRGAMGVGLAGVGVALVWVTATTAIGFLSNLTSPVPPIQDFGIVSSVGIVAALLVFGILIPALKVEIDEFLEGRGFDRKKPAFGTGGGRFSSVLSIGATAARKAPYLLLIGAVLLSAAGAVGGSQVDTSFDQESFLAEDPPDWSKNLPEPFKPGEYSAKENLEYVNQNFLRQDSQAQILIEGPVATSEAIGEVHDARLAAGNDSVAPNVQVLSDGEPDIRSPLSVMQSVAADNETFNATFRQADTNGDGVPDQNVNAVFDDLFAIAPEPAAGVIHRTDSGYEAVRMVISVEGGTSGSAVTTQMRDIAETVDSERLTTTATGQTILFKIVQDQLLQTVIESLLITLVAVFAFLMFTYRITEGSASLGAFTLLPVVMSVSWILGTMYLLDIPFNILTGMITSLTVGLGVAYSIHLSERYNQELERAETMWDAMETAVTGTGGALLGSAATTVGGFGVLAFAILPPLQQFGIITGLTIIYAFLASVLILPSLLVIWTKYFGPDHASVDDTPRAEAVSTEE